jgi:hypothetical protein
MVNAVAFQCSTASTNPAATSRVHSSRFCITRRRSVRRLTRAGTYRRNADPENQIRGLGAATAIQRALGGQAMLLFLWPAG